MGSRKLVSEKLKQGETPPSLYHAEDMAMYNYESENLQVRASERYPFGTFITAYGRKRSRKGEVPVTPGPVDPCNDSDAKVTPNCMFVLDKLSVAYQ
jgi:hypothetical protein